MLRNTPNLSTHEEDNDMPAHETEPEARHEAPPPVDETEEDPHFPIEEESAPQDRDGDPQAGEPPPYIESPPDPPV